MHYQLRNTKLYHVNKKKQVRQLMQCTCRQRTLNSYMDLRVWTVLEIEY
jgi:hypothetical protein